jgi:hypothetical protein
VVDGVPTSFDHLWPFDMTLTRPAKRELPAMCIDIRVVFDCHVCTEAYDSTRHRIEDGSASLWLDAGRMVRVFHRDRYALSHALPDLLRGLPEGKTKCYGTKRSNYMVWKPHGTGDGAPHYQVFFDLYRTNEPKPRLVMYVQSAYLKDRPLGIQRKSTLIFATICAETMGLIARR